MSKASHTEDDVVICAARRTPMGAFQGCFAGMEAPKLAASAIAAVMAEASPTAPNLADKIEQLYMGCVLPAGLGQAPARQAALAAGLPISLPCTTLNKMCGSGLEAIILGANRIRAGSSAIVLAGGMENMSRAPYLLPRARAGQRMGGMPVQDHMFLDGLEDAYDKGKLMGFFADECAREYNISREAQDAWALRSLTCAKTAMETVFDAEIAPVSIESKGAAHKIIQDETPLRGDANKISLLKPAFQKDGSVTAANASSIADGAAVLLLARRSAAKAEGLPILAKICASATHAQAPAWFTTAPIGAMQKLLGMLDWQADAVDAYEINEAFAVVTLVAMQAMNLPAEKVNSFGGACALGHPIGASGARILVTLLNRLRQQEKQEGKTVHKRGIASICIGGGEALALALELEPV